MTMKELINELEQKAELITPISCMSKMLEYNNGFKDFFKKLDK